MFCLERVLTRVASDFIGQFVLELCDVVAEGCQHFVWQLPRPLQAPSRPCMMPANLLSLCVFLDVLR